MSKQRRLARLAIYLTVVFWSSARALDSPLDHVHNADTVDWQRPGSPALPWTNAQANDNNHQHLTADSFDVVNRHWIHSAWDDRDYHYTPNQPNDHSHGLIRPDHQVRFYADTTTLPGRAATIIASAYANWQKTARAQYEAHREPWDAIGIGFTPGTAAAQDIRLWFNPALAGSYGEWFGRSGRNEIEFIDNPSIRLSSGFANVRLRLTSGATEIIGTSVTVPVGWSYDGVFGDGAAAERTWDVDYSVDGGAWLETAPAGLTDLNWSAARTETTPAGDTITLRGMDFRTIATHEIGHSLGLGHPQNRDPAAGAGPAGNVMRWDIANDAVFGRSLGINNNSALATAIDYTWSFDTNSLKDFGDAPNSYGTYAASNGPRYQEGSDQRLGRRWDAEPEGQPTVGANGDDDNYWGVGGPDDEDGVIFGDSWVDVIVNILRPGLTVYRLSAWFDTNWNGIFDHAAELFVDAVLELLPGEHTFHYDLGIDPRLYYSRFRLTWLDDPDRTLQNGGLTRFDDIGPVGEFAGADGISHGEVEDYAPIPEPATLVLFGVGLFGGLLYRRARAPAA